MPKVIVLGGRVDFIDPQVISAIEVCFKYDTTEAKVMSQCTCFRGVHLADILGGVEVKVDCMSTGKLRIVSPPPASGPCDRLRRAKNKQK